MKKAVADSLIKEEASAAVSFVGGSQRAVALKSGLAHRA
jgi:hypothetical protein